MSNQLIHHSYYCPYCGKNIDTWVDTTQGSIQTIEDCSVCCRPIELNIEIDDINQTVNLTARSDTE